MNTKRIVISGGPGSGKTTLICKLEELGYKCIHEISRQVTLEAQKEGIDQLFLTDPLLFSDKLLKGRLDQFHQAKDHSEKFLFYDRGMPDVTAYMDYLGTSYPDYFDKTCQEHRYDLVFILPPWEDIYEQDNERYESFFEAEKIFTYLLDGYRKYDYDAQVVPVGDVDSRIDYILEQQKSLL